MIQLPMLSLAQTHGISIMELNKIFPYLIMPIAIMIYVLKLKLSKTSKFFQFEIAWMALNWLLVWRSTAHEDARRPTLGQFSTTQFLILLEIASIIRITDFIQSLDTTTFRDGNPTGILITMFFMFITHLIILEQSTWLIFFDSFCWIFMKIVKLVTRIRLTFVIPFSYLNFWTLESSN